MQQDLSENEHRSFIRTQEGASPWLLVVYDRSFVISNGFIFSQTQETGDKYCPWHVLPWFFTSPVNTGFLSIPKTPELSSHLG